MLSHQSKLCDWHYNFYNIKYYLKKNKIYNKKIYNNIKLIKHLYNFYYIYLLYNILFISLNIIYD